MRGGLPIDGGVESKNDFGDVFIGHAVDELGDAQLIRADRVQCGQRAAQHVVAALEHRRALHRPKICHVFHHADFSVGAFFAGANPAYVGGGYVAAIQAFTSRFGHGLHGFGHRGHQQTAFLDQMQNRTACRAGSEPWQARHHVNQSIDFFGCIVHGAQVRLARAQVVVENAQKEGISMRLGEVSFWYQAMGGLPAPRAPLQGNLDADVCIIGAGYSGLWTAYYLKRADPALNIAIVERRFAGYGASGRNGGWLTSAFPWKHETYAARSDPSKVRRMVQALYGAVDEVIAVAEAERIDADIHRTEELTIATNPGQMTRMRDELLHRRHWGEGEDQLYELSGDAARQRCRVPGVLGALAQRGVARIQPAKLVQGLARAVESFGVQIFEGTAVERYASGQVHTETGMVRAPVIIRATEGYTADLQQSHRDWLPLNSAQIVTEPLPQDIWNQIGWDGGELLGDMSHVYCYCQRTADGRIVVGSRGVPYLWGSRTDTDGAPDQVSVARLQRILRRYFPAAAKARIDHAWCGVLGVPRDWCATVGFDQESGIGWLGGYGGVGASTSNLAARTVVDLVLRRESELTTLSWVNRRVRKWEPEPIRWLGVRGKYGMMHGLDWWEKRADR